MGAVFHEGVSGLVDSEAPHVEQKVAPSAFWAPQERQNTAVSFRCRLSVLWHVGGGAVLQLKEATRSGVDRSSGREP